MPAQSKMDRNMRSGGWGGGVFFVCHHCPGRHYDFGMKVSFFSWNILGINPHDNSTRA